MKLSSSGIRCEQRNPVPQPMLLRAATDFPGGVRYMCLLHVRHRLGYDVRMLRGQVVGLSQIGAKVEELDIAIQHWLADGLPVAKANGLPAALFVEFPVEIGMLLLILFS